MIHQERKQEMASFCHECLTLHSNDNYPYPCEICEIRRSTNINLIIFVLILFILVGGLIWLGT